MRLAATCSLCGHEYEHLFDTAESSTHLAEAHGMYFDPKPLHMRRSEPPIFSREAIEAAADPELPPGVIEAEDDQGKRWRYPLREFEE